MSRELRLLAGRTRPLPRLSTKDSCGGGGLAPFTVASDGPTLFVEGVPCGTSTHAPSGGGFVAWFDGARWEALALPPRTANVFASARAGAVEWLLTERATAPGRGRRGTTGGALVPARYGRLLEVALEPAPLRELWASWEMRVSLRVGRGLR